MLIDGFFWKWSRVADGRRKMFVLETIKLALIGSESNLPIDWLGRIRDLVIETGGYTPSVPYRLTVPKALGDFSVKQFDVMDDVTAITRGPG